MTNGASYRLEQSRKRLARQKNWSGLNIDNRGGFGYVVSGWYTFTPPFTFGHGKTMKKAFNVLTLIETSEAYGQRLLRGIMKYSYLHGPWTFHTGIPLYRRVQIKTRTRAIDLGCQGVITYIPNSKGANPDIISELPAIVFHDTTTVPALDSRISTSSDYTATGKMGAEYLLNRGFRLFAYCGFRGKSWSDLRGKSFAKEIAQAGFVTYCNNPPTFPQKQGYREISTLADWLKSLPKPIGLMACNDDRAQQVIKACYSEDIYVPDEIAVLGVDNDDLICGLTNPALSSIALGAEKAGYEAAQILDRLMKKQKVGEHTIVIEPTHVVTRQSTEILATEDREVADAIRFIRLNSDNTIQVNDVVNETGLSRTSLSERFIRSVGHSIHKEIKRVRTEKIIKYILESDMSITQMAIKMGYRDVDHISRYFKQEKGVSPQAFRSKHKA